MPTAILYRMGHSSDLVALPEGERTIIPLQYGIFQLKEEPYNFMNDTFGQIIHSLAYPYLLLLFFPSFLSFSAS